MSSGLATRLQRGAAVGLALSLSVPVLAESALDLIKRQHRQDSYIVIEQDGVYTIVFVDTLEQALLVDEQGEDVELLYDAVDEDDPMMVSRLSQALRAESRDTRLAAVRLLGEIDSPDARAALESVLHNADAELRLEVVESIADTPGAEPLLRVASDDAAGPVAATARQYLAERQAR